MKFLIIFFLLIQKFDCLYENKLNIKIKHEQWTPQLIFDAQRYKNCLIDPDDYIDSFDDKIKIVNLIDDIKTEKNIDVTIIYITKISDTYLDSNDQKKDINKFVDELSSLLVNKNHKDDSFSLIILFSVDDRQLKLRTGPEAKKIINNRDALRLINEIKSELKNKNYSAAGIKLLTNINEIIKGNKGGSFLSYLSLIVCFSCLYSCVYCYKKKPDRNAPLRNPVAENKLERIKEITKRNEGKIQFTEKICVICLDNFPNKEDENKETTEPLINNHLNQNIEIQNDKIQEKNFTNANLDCGHIFHPKCIAQWMEKNNNCPICRSIIDKEGQDIQKPIQQGLVEIQSDIHPELNNYNYDYSSGFSYVLSNLYINNYYSNDNYNGCLISGLCNKNDGGNDWNSGGNDWNGGGGADGDW